MGRAMASCFSFSPRLCRGSTPAERRADGGLAADSAIFRPRFAIVIFIRRNLDRDLILPIQPASQIDQFATLGTKRKPPRRLTRLRFLDRFFADGALHCYSIICHAVRKFEERNLEASNEGRNSKNEIRNEGPANYRSRGAPDVHPGLLVFVSSFEFRPSSFIRPLRGFVLRVCYPAPQFRRTINPHSRPELADPLHHRRSQKRGGIDMKPVPPD